LWSKCDYSVTDILWSKCDYSFTGNPLKSRCDLAVLFVIYVWSITQVFDDCLLLFADYCGVNGIIVLHAYCGVNVIIVLKAVL
jgi:hypothetical protein